MKILFRDIKGSVSLKVIGAAVIGLAVVVLLLFQLITKKETIKVGAIVSLTGTGSEMSDLRDAMLMAVDEINSVGGVNGRKIELLVEDSKTDPKEGTRAFERLENSNSKPVIYLSTLSNVGLALKPLVKKHQVVLVGANTSTPQFIADNKWVFRHFTTTAEEIRGLKILVKDLKVKSLGILYLDDPYGNAIQETFQKNNTGSGIEVTTASFSKGVKDLSSQLQALQPLEAICIVGFTTHTALAIRQLRLTHYPGIILTPSGGANPKVTLMEQAEGVYILAPIIYNSLYPFTKTFQKKFEAGYQKPLSHQAANGYDFIKIFAGLIEGKEVSRHNIRDLLDQGFMYSGVLGNQELEPGGQEIAFPLYPARIENRKIRFLQN